MDRFVDERDHLALEGDRYTFFVLNRIMDGDCRLLLSDHENLIICYSEPPYPVWIWTPDDVTAEICEKAYKLISEHSLLERGMHFNVKDGLAELLIRRAAKDSIKISVSMNMFAYDCPDPIEPGIKADGGLRLCAAKNTDELAGIIEKFADETNVDKKSGEAYRKDAEEYIDSGMMYFWENSEGRITASCRCSPNGDMAAINLVYTYPEFRRRHYAENLVFEVTRIAKEEGYMPMLYTDANYTASNACYEKIGYVLRGKLSTIMVT